MMLGARKRAACCLRLVTSVVSLGDGPQSGQRCLDGLRVVLVVLRVVQDTPREPAGEPLGQTVESFRTRLDGVWAATAIWRDARSEADALGCRSAQEGCSWQLI